VAQFTNIIAVPTSFLVPLDKKTLLFMVKKQRFFFF